ncbi:hypothetical protein KCTC32516_01134 [Polaribacter huanghezhanensis]|uniref:hypothetical protein n=1 Tax=Polaribacter huanghezhanensis TaxID=1354726 RepID=UPI00264A3A14|nr:hypothetical protein [Polaribacter huanghezhanensis]WKD85788.1 hypothetical protein KCTC32516_01134 [Polaribacter huanghezhanensis]
MKKWMKVGLLWGLFMFVIMTFVWPAIVGDEISLKRILIAIPIWILGGIIFGYTMRKNYKEEKK